MTDADTFFHFNAHTHGLAEKLDHLDFEIVIPMSEDRFMPTFHNLVGLIRQGRKFVAGQRTDEITDGGYHVEFAASKECDRDVLRVIIPDKNDITGPAAAHPFYHQWHEIAREPAKIRKKETKPMTN